MQTMSFDQRKQLMETMLNFEIKAEALSFRCRLWLWRYATNCNNMILTHKKYVKEL